MRIGGLASGMDIDQLVKDLMKAERMPLDKLKQKKQTLEWQRDDFRSMNTLLLDFRQELTQMKLTTKYRARTTSSTHEQYITATASSAANQSSYSISKVSQLAAAETQKNGGSIIGDGKEFDAAKGLYEQRSNFAFQGVNVWKDGFVQSKQVVTTGDNKEVQLDLTNEKSDSQENWSVTVNGVGYKVVTTTPTEGAKEAYYDTLTGKLHLGVEVAKDSVVRVNYVVNTKTEALTLGNDTTEWKLSYGSIQDSASIKLKVGTGVQTLTVGTDGKILNGDGKHVATLDKATGSISFSPVEQSILPAKDSKNTVSMEITYDSSDAKYTSMNMSTHTSKGEMYGSFLIDGRDSLNSVISNINNSSLGVSMFYDKMTNQMTLTRNETGDFNKDAANNGGKEVYISLDDDKNSFLRDVLRFKAATVTQQAADAKFTINGLDTYRNSNTFEMNGVTFTLKQTFDPAKDASQKPVTVNINNDSSKVFDNIKEFVTKYNELIDKIQKKTSEDRYRSYTPLTDMQREQLSDKQQEQWEEKAKSGLLRRDPILSSILTEMRMDLSGSVSNDGVSNLFNQLAKLGITTSANYLEGGKLEINEAKLKKAIEDDPQSVENFFRGDGITESQKGVMHRLYDSVNSAMDKLREKAGNTFSVSHQFAIGRELKNIDTRIDSFENRLKLVEDRYWKQFTAMEKAIMRSNEQMSFLMQQFSGN